MIVLDVDMPGKDGLEVLQFIRLQDSQTPVIIYSCLIDEEKQIKGLEWGANVYLLKNYSPTLLLAQIQRCIARSGEEVIRLSKHIFKQPLCFMQRGCSNFFIRSPGDIKPPNNSQA